MKHIWIGRLLCFLNLLACTSSFGLSIDRGISQFMHTAWTAKDGAPSGVVSMAQTTDGFLWLGTENGLYRFDGVTFERYEPPSWAAFPFAGVRILLALPNGDLWIGFQIGIISVLRDGNVRNYTAADGMPAGWVLSLAQDGEGTIWAATSAGLARLEGNRWKEIGKDWSFPGNLASAVFVDRKGILWVATEDTIVFLPPGTRQFRQTGARVGQVVQFCEAPNGKLWMAETTRSVRPVPLGDKRPPSDDAEIQVGSAGILFDRDGALWITTLGDGMRRDPHPEILKGKAKEFSTTVESLTSKDGLSADEIYAILQDREGSIWVSTSNGVDRFGKVNLVPITSLPFPANQAVLAAGDDGDLLIGSNLSGRIVRLHDGRTYSEGRLESLQGSYRDPHGIVSWVGQDGIFRSKDGRVSKLPLPKGFPIPYLNIMRITGDYSGNLWLAAAYKGVFRLKNGNWIKIEDGHGLAQVRPVSLAFTDWLGRAWFAYEAGRIVILDGTNVERLYSSQDSLIQTVRAIHGGEGHVWVGGDSGLSLFRGNRFFPVIADRTPFRNILEVMETPGGDLWLCESRGVLHIPSAEVRKVLDNPASRVNYELFDPSDGLPGVFSNIMTGRWPREIQGTDGRIWFATANGIASIDPSNSLKNTLPPPVVIRSVGADQKQYSSLTKLILPALTRSIRIGYTGLSLSVPERVRFRYKLDGVDRDWQDAGARREAFYNNLGPASYRFQVIASNNDGVWNVQGADLDFSIAPAWHQTTFFLASCLAVSLLFLWALYRRHLQQIEKRFNFGLEARVNERTRIARELHDTMLQSFQGLLLRLQAVSNLLPNRADEAKRRLDGAIDQAAQAITEGRDAVGDLRASTVSACDLDMAINTLGEELLAEHGGDNPPLFHLQVEGMPRDLQPILRDEVYRIGSEALRNAFRHGKARRIEAEIRYDTSQLRLRLRDDGKGIAAKLLNQDGEPGHWGLPGMRERAKLIGGRLDVWSELHSGTEVELSVPASLAYATSRSPRRRLLPSWLERAFSRTGRPGL